MTLNEFIYKLQNIKSELKDTEIALEAPNGMLLTPKIQFMKYKKKRFSLDISRESVEQIIITWQGK